MLLIIFLPISLNICFGCSKELSHLDGSFEYPQHMFWLRDKKNIFLLHSLIWGPGVLKRTVSYVVGPQKNCLIEMVLLSTTTYVLVEK